MGNSVTRFAKIAAFIVMSIAATESHALAQSKSGRIDKLITLYHEYGQFNGVILVAQRGQVVYEHAFGQSNFELNSANTLDTKFEIASITKPMTALLIMQLVEHGKVSLHRKVSDYVSYYPR
jgi:CubicO group peptidase (beta-lactamase class C family)